MPYYNAIQAAHYIGCDPKTVRRMLKRGELTGERTERGWLAIPGGQVEYAKIRWEEEQAKFARPGQPREALGEVSKIALPKAIEALDSLGRLETRIGQLEEIVSAQNERIASLEKALSNASLHVPIQPVPVPATSAIPPKPQPSIRNVEPSSVPPDIPPGSLLMTDFAAQHNVHRSTALRHCTQGIKGDCIDAIEQPKPGGRKGDMERWLTPAMQEAAIDFWIRHKVKFTQH